MTSTAPPPIPRAAGSLPFIGHALRMRDNLGFIDSLRDTREPLVEIVLQPGTRTVVVQDPALIHQMLRALAPTLDKGRLYDKLGQLLGDSVVTATGRNHVRKRRQVQPAFAHAEIGRYVDIMRAEVAATVAGWEPGRTLDVREAMVGLSLDMLAKTVFAGSLDDAVFRRLRSDLSVVLNDVGVRIMLPDWTERLPLPFNRRFDRARAGVRATINSAVDELQASGHDTGDMLSMLLRAVDEETGEPLTGHQICSEILTLAVAGTETTASVLSWLLYELARNPGIEARVLAELDEVLGERPVALADVTRLTYLNRVITETLRLHHPGWLVTRRTTEETRLGEWTLPAGTELAYCQHALHRDPERFPNPHTFDPDRWTDPAQEPPPGAFLPFGDGKHKCMGDRLALTEMVTALATLLRSVRLELSEGQVIRQVARLTVRPRTLRMTVRPRNRPRAGVGL
ncbi:MULTISPECIES: cytochrome P450 [unclassified Streptomyces]|uniref:cytochrome P450 n=1 Tax=unclassified Streptomyces TaxID=2593676 RepID=UPI00225A1077|nr:MULTISPECIES: cytochrome P450 [unclassified Streptomyces]MCX5052318.1 cytochrome P450 [Streptomyces sp. NBC_00474]MCX5064064.1 cytochrome P450 [Streptomyces sp. NBC_00452]MCX5251485.1 cytochrome P450 [Streptomyces sp. NBC_00201]MCX5294591.1 cytochrome P450 [Streptomyces sp. NBC_00183]